MSNLTGNKIMGGLLATFLIVVGVPQIAGMIFDKEPPEKPGMAVEVQEEASTGPAADNPPDWGTVLATANADAGKGSAAACGACHNMVSGGPNMTGPNLFGLVGRKPGTHAGYAYSDAMVEFGGKNPAWDYDALYTFLKAPGKDVPGTKMTYAGMKDPQTRINVIAYLHTLGSSLPSRRPILAASPPPPAPRPPRARSSGPPPPARPPPTRRRPPPLARAPTRFARTHLRSEHQGRRETSALSF